MLYPVSNVFPMGFSWSSYVAQETLLGRCAAAGLEESMILAEDAPAPCDVSEAFALATDDIMHFTTRGAPRAAHRMARLEKALDELYVQASTVTSGSITISNLCVNIHCNTWKRYHILIMCKDIL